MKKKFLIILGILIVLLLLTYGIIFFVDYNKVSHGKIPVFAIKSDTENYYGLGYSVNVKYYKNTNNIEKIEMYAFGKTVAGTIFSYNEENLNANNIIVENGKIKNENLLDKFIENSNNKQASILQINNISNENIETITLEYVPGENYINNNISSENTTVNSIVPDVEWNSENYQKYYGYYKLIKNNNEEKFDNLHWNIKRLTNGNTVQLIFYSYYFDLTEIPVIFEYNLDSSLYKKTFDLTYISKKDNKIKQIAKTNQFDNIDFGLYTLEGDVTITIEQDMAYSLEDALNKKIISVQNILDQAKLDEKYGICSSSYYKDGGSIEYKYPSYTILKFNTLGGNKDLIIGMSGSIINNDNFKNLNYRNTN